MLLTPLFFSPIAFMRPINLRFLSTEMTMVLATEPMDKSRMRKARMSSMPIISRPISRSISDSSRKSQPNRSVSLPSQS